MPSIQACRLSGRVIPNFPRYSMSIERQIHMESTMEPSRSKITASIILLFPFRFFCFCHVSTLLPNIYTTNAFVSHRRMSVSETDRGASVWRQIWLISKNRLTGCGTVLSVFSIWPSAFIWFSFFCAIRRYPCGMRWQDLICGL